MDFIPSNPNHSPAFKLPQHIKCVCVNRHYSNYAPNWPTHDIHIQYTQGGTDLERGYGDVQPWRPPFHASPAVCKGPISSKRVGSQDPLLRKFGNFSLYSLNFRPNFSSQAPNLKIFSSQAPKLGNFQFTSPPFQRQISVRTPTWKKSECPPPPPRSIHLLCMLLIFSDRWNCAFEENLLFWACIFHIQVTLCSNKLPQFSSSKHEQIKCSTNRNKSMIVHFLPPLDD